MNENLIADCKICRPTSAILRLITIMPQKNQITEDMVKPITKNLLLGPTILKDVISESGIEIVPKQSIPTHNIGITEESVTCSFVNNEIFMKNLIAKVTSLLPYLQVKISTLPLKCR